MSRIRNPLHLEIIPSPGVEKEWGEIEKKIESILPFAESVHIDVLDGKFAQSTTWMDPLPFVKYAKRIRLEAHFMTENPLQYVKSFARAGFQRFIGQIEKMSDIAEFLGEAQLLGEAGLAVDRDTPVETLFPYLKDIDVACVMTVKAGLSYQDFLPDCLEKAKKLREKESMLAIEIDGGVADWNITLAKEIGVTRFVSTGFLFGNKSQKSAEEQYFILQKLLHGS